MTSRHAMSAIIVLCLAGCDGQVDRHADRSAGSGTRHTLALSNADSEHLGLLVSPAPPATYTPHVRGYGVVLNFSALAQSLASVAIAQAAVTESHAALEDARALFGQPHSNHAVSRQALDAAVHRAANDDAQLELAYRQETSVFGQHAPWRTSERDSPILARLASGHAVLVQATFPLGVTFPAAPTVFFVTHLNTGSDERSWTATNIWDAPSDPSIPGRSFYALVEDSDLAQGEHTLIVAPTGKPMSGVQISSDAVVLSEDKAWCYVFYAPHTFYRLPIDLDRALDGGYFVARGIAPNQPVVVKGAGLLLARELGIATPGQD
jgi:hypothetical protein